MSALDNITAEVTNNTSVVESAVALLKTLKADLDAAIAANSMAAVQALSDKLAANDKALADAIAANTPAAPPAPVPAPAPAPVSPPPAA